MRRERCFFGRLSPVGEELAGETGAALAASLTRVDALVLDDADFEWAGRNDPDREIQLLTDILSTRLSGANYSL